MIEYSEKFTERGILMFQTAFITVVTALLYAVPGYLLFRFKKVREEQLSAIATVLMYVCSPCLTIYSFEQADYSNDLLIQVFICLAFAFVLMLFIILAFRFIFGRKMKDSAWRVASVAAGMGNYAFLGLPVLNALLPDHPQAMVFSAAFTVAMNVIAWTVTSMIITEDKKYISIKKVILNPATLSFIVSLPMFIFGVKFDSNIVLSSVGTVITLLSKMSTALCMLLLGMRLASMKFRTVFLNPLSYAAVFCKQLLFPVLCYGCSFLLPFDPYIRTAILILSSCPVASVVLNMSELLGRGQKAAASCVLLGTVLSVVTIPFLMLIFG